MKTVVWFGFVLAALSAAGKVILIKPGQRATLECGFGSYTTSLEWCRENELIISIDGKTGLPRNGKIGIVKRARVRTTNLDISGVKEEDAGKFTCKVDGNSQQHTLLVVSVWASPSGDLQLGSQATLQCQVKGLIPEPTVQWKRPDQSSHTGPNIVRLQSVARSDAGTWYCTFSHDSVTYSESLDIKVVDPASATPAPVPSQTSKDIHKSPCVNCATNARSEDDLLLGLRWWMWVVIGVGCLVVVLLLIFVICLCKRVKRKKKKLQRMKNGRQPLTKQFCQCNHQTAAAKPRQGRRREKPSALPVQPLLMT